LHALDSGVVAGAGLDVLENETEMTDSTKKLLTHPRVIVTPHVAFDTQEAIQRILDTTKQNLEAFRMGNPINTVTLHATS
jgi:D-lactate dehydrogenase